MRLPDILLYQRRRLRSPKVWVPMAGLGLLMAMVQILVLLKSVPMGTGPAVVFGLVAGVGFAMLYIGLSPMPWLWTRSRATHAPLLRGALQALAFNAAFVLLLTLVEILLTWRLKLDHRLGLALGTFLAGTVIHAPAAALLGYFITLWERTKFLKEETEKKLREAHWVLLRGQLSPHALFNALNGLAELVHIDPVAAEKGLLDLAGLYRSLLDHGSRPSAPLRDERTLVERYLAIEQIRLGTRLHVTWDWNSELDSLETPPFLVQPLVENAIKHGIAPAREGGELHIALRHEEDELVIRVMNGGKPLPLVLGNGVGVANLEGRLYLAFGARARLHLGGESGNLTRAEIRIDMDCLRRKP